MKTMPESCKNYIVEDILKRAAAGSVDTNVPMEQFCKNNSVPQECIRNLRKEDIEKIRN